MKTAAGKPDSQAEVRAQSNSEDQREALPFPKSKWRPGALTLFLGFVAVLFLGSWAGYSLWKGSLQSQLDVEIAKIRERGEPVWFADARPEPVPEEENGRADYMRACGEYWESRRAARDGNRPAMWAYLNGYYSGGHGPHSQVTPVQIAELDALFAENPRILPLLRQALGKSVIQLEYDYDTEETLAIVLEPVATSRSFSRLLLLHADCSIAFANRDWDRAVQTVVDQLQLAHSLRMERFTVSQLVRATVVWRAMNSLQEILGHTALTQEQFANLDQLLLETEAGFRLRDTLLAERSMYLTASTYASQEMFAHSNSDVSSWEQWAYVNFEALRLREQVALLELMSECAELVDDPSPKAGKRAVEVQHRLEAIDDYGLGNESYPVVLRQVALRTRQNCINARIAMRVARFYHENGRLPATLEDVTDDALPTIEPGLMLWQSLSYEVTSGDEGFGFDIVDPGADGLDANGRANAQEAEQVISVRFGEGPGG